MVDGTATQIDPSFKLVDTARPFARKLIPQQFEPEKIFKATLRSQRAYARLFDHLPVQLTCVRGGRGRGSSASRPLRAPGERGVVPDQPRARRAAQAQQQHGAT